MNRIGDFSIEILLFLIAILAVVKKNNMILIKILKKLTKQVIKK
jgi:hypothetical protein